MTTANPSAMPFDLIHSPLDGRVLLEASAGTGKTFSVTKMALRFLLQTDYRLEQILLVTFTNLATAELKSALTADCHRLAEWVAVIIDASGGSLTPVTLQRYIEQHETTVDDEQRLWLALLSALTPEQLASAADRLQLATKTIDLASVMTLHEFAGRVVSTFGFQVQAPLDTIVSLDTAHYRQHATADFYRQHYLHGQSPALPLLSQQQLANLLSLALNKPGVAIHLPDEQALVQRAIIHQAQRGQCSWPEALRALQQPLREAYQQAFAVFSQQWPTWHEPLLALHSAIEAQQAAHPGWFKKTAYLRNWLADHQAWLADWLLIDDPERAFAALPLYRDDVKNPDAAHSLFAFSAETFQSAFLNKAASFPVTEVMTQLGAFAPVFAHYDHAVSAFADTFMAYAQAWLSSRYHALLARDYRCDISAAFTQLDQVLSGAAAERIASTVRAAYPVAIVDEFQDTDPEQFRILARIYPDHRAHHLIMVGDPKQSIYRFRGADIYAYLAVIRQVNYYYYLTVNYRSDPGIVAGVNQLFVESTEATVTDPTFRIPGLTFFPVAAHHAAPRLSGIERPPIQLVMAGQDAPSEAEWIDWLFGDIYQLLRQGKRHANDDQQPLSLDDVAILVRSNTLGKTIYAVAKRLGYNAVLHADDNVLQTPAAQSLDWVLQVLLAPRTDEMSFALLSAVFGWSAQQIVAQKASGEWLSTLSHWHRASTTWHEVGIAAALDQLFRELAVAESLLARGNVRLLADLEQLIELLHSQEHTSDGSPEQLSQWFSRVVAEPEAWQGDDQAVVQRRLDTDQPALTIMTIHKSKGLEFPVVYLPNLFAFATAPGDALKVAHIATPTACLDEAQAIAVPNTKARHLPTSWLSEFIAQVEREWIAEHIRLLYVALTRASSQLVLMDSWQEKRYRTPKHPLYALLHRPGSAALDTSTSPEDSDSPYEALAELVAARPEVFGCQLLNADDIREPRYWQPPVPEVSEDAALIQQRFPYQLRPSWVMTSFSTLQRQSKAAASSIDAESSIAAHAEVSAGLTVLDERLGELGETSAPVPARSILISAANTVSREITPEVISDEITHDLPYRFLFPAGAIYGTFLHDILETVEIRELGAATDVAHDAITRLLTSHALPQPIAARSLLQWLSEVVQRPLVAQQSLMDWSATSFAEIEFSFPVTAAGLRRFVHHARDLEPLFPGVSAWLATHPLALAQLAERGYLRGFIDLTFRAADGRYGILDYKSNHLGNSDAVYASEALTDVMVESGYWLQMVIYLIALHRWLSQRLMDYRYERDVGGGVYLFLRGMAAEVAAEQGIFYRAIPESLLLTLSDALSEHECTA